MKTGFVIAGALLTTLLVIGCASTPKVSPHVTTILNEMSEQQAAEVIQRLLQPRNLSGNQTRTFITGHIGLGLCKANQFSLDEERWHDLHVTAEGKGITVCPRCGARIVADVPPGAVIQVPPVSYAHPVQAHVPRNHYPGLYMQPKHVPRYAIEAILKVPWPIRDLQPGSGGSFLECGGSTVEWPAARTTGVAGPKCADAAPERHPVRDAARGVFD